MNILLCCSAGMSTSLLVTKMEKEAVAQGMDAKIWAVSATEARQHIGQADVMLLGPQIRYMINEMKKLGTDHNIPVEVINQMHYGMCNGKAVLNDAKTLIEKGI
jgi:PTS system cellobiose-specific IIB component